MSEVPPPAPAPPAAVSALALIPPPTPPPGPLTYRERLAQFRILEEKRIELIEELLDKLEKTEARLAQTELDLNSEQNVRRTLQAEVHEAKTREDALAQKQAKRPFVLVLIDVDAEGFLFQDKYITKKAQGGEALADELLIRTREYLRPQFEDADNLDIIVRVYANLEGLAKYLVRQDKISNLGSLRAMSTSFSGRIASFDFVDVGVNKEGSSGRKIRGENLSFFTANSHLRHVIVGCWPADLPAALLSTLPLDKVTLIESLPLPAALTSLPLKVTKFSSMFPAPPPTKSSRPTGRNGPQLQLMQQEDDNGGQTWLVIQPERSDSNGRHRDSKRRGRSEDEASNISISIGADNSSKEPIRWYRTPFYNATVLGFCSLAAPGLWGAMNSLGAGGAQEPYLVNTANALTFCLMIISCWLTSSLVKYVGIKGALVAGTIGFVPYSAGLYTNNRFGTEWLVILGAALCGISAGIFWASEASIAIAYPEPKNRGRMIAYWITWTCVGRILGGAINLGLNHEQYTAGKVGEAVYYTYIALWFSVRARSSGSFLSGVISIIVTNLLGAWLDTYSVALKKRARWAFAVIMVTQGAWWIWLTINMTQFSQSATLYDWADEGFGRAFAPFIFLVAGFQLNYNFAFFLIGQISKKSAWQALSYGLNAIPIIATVGGTYINFGIWAVALVPAWPVIRTIGIRKYNDEADFGGVERSEETIGEKGNS
ncbi:hypothetical protein E8E11_001346 [Didymella keratinophila]|nr:hypothetical protein E8E11_001346 [Didymella keratinophila]